MVKFSRTIKKCFLRLLKIVLVFGLFLFLHVSMYSVYIRSRQLEMQNQTVKKLSRFKDICVEKRNFVFIKCMKCATETLATIVRRFGLKRILNFVLPVKNNIYLGWPFIMEKSDYRPSKWEYNILFEHAIYNLSVMSAIMPYDTIYLTSIRHPWNRLVSSYQYFHLDKLSFMEEDNFTEYIHNIAKYEQNFAKADNQERSDCFPPHFSMVKNLQGHCLGMPLGFPEGREDISTNITAIQEHIRHIEGKFSLVMIVEYMTESLVLLKRIMCWKLQDIIHHVSNVIGKNEKFQKGDNYKIYHNYSHIDFIIYDHFNKTFWEKVQDQGLDFYDEVNHFKLIQLLCNQFCFVQGNTQTHGRYLTIPESRFNEAFNITSEECHLMDRYLLIDLREQYNQIEQPPKEEETGEWYKPPRGCSGDAKVIQ